MKGVCGVCGKTEETVIHALSGCIFARLVWEKRRLCEEVDGNFRSFMEFAEACLTKLSSKDRALFMTLCWVVWGARNKWIMEGEAFEVERGIEYADKLLLELAGDEGGIEEEGNQCAAAEEGWKAPNGEVVKINVDAGCLQGLGSSVGAVIRNANKEVLACAVWHFSDMWEAKIAEAKACTMAFLQRNVGLEE